MSDSPFLIELKAFADGLAGILGNRTALTTADKSTHVAALNELVAGLAGALKSAQLGAASGVCPLDSGGRIAAAYLPSYVDDVAEYSSLSELPITGSAGVIYLTQDTNLIYRWSGSVYSRIDPSPGSTDAVPEGSVNLYHTAARVLALLTAANIESGLGFTPYNSTNPSGFQTASQVASALAGYAPLTSPALTGMVKATWSAVNNGAAIIVPANSVSHFVPADCTIKGIVILGQGGAGSCTVDVRKGVLSGWPSTASICGSTLPAIASGNYYQDMALTGWTTTLLNANDTLMFSLQSSVSFNSITVFLIFG